jgi:two-component system response regulator FixJ
MENLNTSEHRVYIVDDDEQVLTTLVKYLRVLGYRARGFPSADALLDSLELTREVSCIITDVRMPKMNGVELLAELGARGHQFPTIVITGHGDIPIAVSAMKAGAIDFLEKPFDPAILETAISHAITSWQYRQDKSEKIEETRRRISEFSERQRQILDFVKQGLTSKEIAQRVGLSFRTVETHRAFIMEHLEARNLADLIRIALLAELSPNPL